MFRRYVHIVTAVGAKQTFETGFDLVWNVSHHFTDECLCSTVHRSMAATKCAVDALGFAWSICITLDLDLGL
jgi:hypothetical protein